MASVMFRIREMIQAQAHQALDDVEPPRALAQQLLRDLGDEIQRAQRALVLALAAQKRLQHERQRAEEEADTWAQRAEALLRAGDEGMARAALERAALGRRRGAGQAGSQAAVDANVDRARAQLERLKRELAEARLQAARIDAADTAAKVTGVFDDAYTRSAARAGTLERLLHKAGGAACEAEAAAQLLDEQTALSDAVGAAELNADVDAALAELKRRVRGGTAESGRDAFGT